MWLVTQQCAQSCLKMVKNSLAKQLLPALAARRVSLNSASGLLRAAIWKYCCGLILPLFFFFSVLPDCMAQATTSPSTPPVLNLLTEEYPPFNMSDPKTGGLHGIAVEKVQEMMRRAQEKFTLSSLPWTRAYQLGLQMEDTCVFSTTRTPEREPLFKWVGPLVHNNWMVFARADDRRSPKKLEDLRPYVMGGYQSDAVGEFLKAQGFKVDLAISDADNPRKLLHKRFDFWATGELLGKWLIKNGAYNGKIIPLFTFRHTEMYLACNSKMPTARVEKLNHILREMAQDGVVEVIEQRYR